jgi:hypothetical protein
MYESETDDEPVEYTKPSNISFNIPMESINNDFLKNIMGWGGGVPPRAESDREYIVLCKFDEERKKRKINKWLYELRWKKATSIRKAKKYAKILGVTFNERDMNKHIKLVCFKNARITQVLTGDIANIKIEAQSYETKKE